MIFPLIYETSSFAVIRLQNSPIFLECSLVLQRANLSSSTCGDGSVSIGFAKQNLRKRGVLTTKVLHVHRVETQIIDVPQWADCHRLNPF